MQPPPPPPPPPPPKMKKKKKKKKKKSLIGINEYLPHDHQAYATTFESNTVIQ